MNIAKSLVFNLLDKFNVKIHTKRYVEELEQLASQIPTLRARLIINTVTIDPSKREQLFELIPQLNSQFLQDLFVLAVLDQKKNGFFVEFGGMDGITGSNTLILEKNMVGKD